MDLQMAYRLLDQARDAEAEAHYREREAGEDLDEAEHAVLDARKALKDEPDSQLLRADVVLAEAVALSKYKIYLSHVALARACYPVTDAARKQYDSLRPEARP